MLIAPLGATYCTNKTQNQYMLYYKLSLTYDAIETRTRLGIKKSGKMDKKTALEIVKKYIDFLKDNKFNIQKAYIFGSYAKGNFNEDSDIDLAIVMNNFS